MGAADLPGVFFLVPRQTLFANLCIIGELSVVVLLSAFVGSLHFGDFLGRGGGQRLLQSLASNFSFY